VPAIITDEELECTFIVISRQQKDCRMRVSSTNHKSLNLTARNNAVERGRHRAINTQRDGMRQHEYGHLNEMSGLIRVQQRSRPEKGRAKLDKRKVT
jgi:hypothetical protein